MFQLKISKSNSPQEKIEKHYVKGFYSTQPSNGSDDFAKLQDLVEGGYFTWPTYFSFSGSIMEKLLSNLYDEEILSSASSVLQKAIEEEFVEEDTFCVVLEERQGLRKKKILNIVESSDLDGLLSAAKSWTNSVDAKTLYMTVLRNFTGNVLEKVIQKLLSCQNGQGVMSLMINDQSLRRNIVRVLRQVLRGLDLQLRNSQSIIAATKATIEALVSEERSKGSLQERKTVLDELQSEAQKFEESP